MSLPHLILGVLKDHAISGYDLNKIFGQTAGNFWQTDQSQIYRALHKMLDEGWVEVEEIIQSDNPNKKIYHITDVGHAELHRWLMTPMEYQPTREAWLGQLFYGGELTTAELETLLHDRLQAAQRVIDLINNVILPNIKTMSETQRVSREGQLRALTLDYASHRLTSERVWLEKALEIVRHLPD
jgi:PadR family transcriptional regulator, regulatory protein AphA